MINVTFKKEEKKEQIKMSKFRIHTTYESFYIYLA